MSLLGSLVSPHSCPPRGPRCPQPLCHVRDGPTLQSPPPPRSAQHLLFPLSTPAISSRMFIPWPVGNPNRMECSALEAVIYGSWLKLITLPPETCSALCNKAIAHYRLIGISSGRLKQGRRLRRCSAGAGAAAFPPARDGQQLAKAFKALEPSQNHWP